MYKPRKEEGAWRVRDGNVMLASLSDKGRFWGDVAYWPALLDAVTEEKYLIHNVDGWEEVEGIPVKYRDYPFARFFMYVRPRRWVSFTEAFTGMALVCGGLTSLNNKRRNALALIKEHGEQWLISSIRKGVRQSGISPVYKNIYIQQYLRGWESTIEIVSC